MSRNQSCSLTALGIVSFLFLFGITSNGTTLVDILLCLCGGALGPPRLPSKWSKPSSH
jgi:hypothetical protein